MIKFYMFIIMPITKVNWSYTESAWQNYGNTWALHLSRNNPGMLLWFSRETSLPLHSFDHVHHWTLGFPWTQHSQWNPGVMITNRINVALKPCKAKLHSPMKLALNNSITPASIKNNGKVLSIVSVGARSDPSLKAVCSSRKKRNLCFSLPLHILCLNLETLPISYSQVDGFHKTDLEFKETFPRCLICCSNERVMLAFMWLIKHTFDQGKLIFANIMHLPQLSTGTKAQQKSEGKVCLLAAKSSPLGHQYSCLPRLPWLSGHSPESHQGAWGSCPPMPQGCNSTASVCPFCQSNACVKKCVLAQQVQEQFCRGWQLGKILPSSGSSQACKVLWWTSKKKLHKAWKVAAKGINIPPDLCGGSNGYYSMCKDPFQEENRHSYHPTTTLT